ncbi:MAG: SWIM zinc finger family protein [Gemmataceae bacterium]|nr:SWIM zinc finger family protein [Gemmataceae bacterium]
MGPEEAAAFLVEVAGRKIADSFWGKAWCENLEAYSDFANRLPRGRSYVRNGSVIDLQIERGKIHSLVSGSDVYNVKIAIKTLPAATWARIKKSCARSIDSLIDLLQGRFDQGIMERLSQRDDGLFPQPREIDMDCSCPDWAGMCKHVAAVLYGVGARLDRSPEMLFTLRDVDHLDLIGEAVDAKNLDQALQGKVDADLRGADLGEVFGIELETSDDIAPTVSGNEAPRSRPTPERRAGKKPVTKQSKPRKTPTEIVAAAQRLAKQVEGGKAKRKAVARA